MAHDGHRARGGKRARRFDTHALGTRGAMIRHLAIDPARNAVWLAYGASPGIPARIARLVPASRP